MLHQHVVDAAFLAKRHLDSRAVGGETPEQPNLDLPPWAFGVALVDFIFFLPALLVVGYTLNQLYLTLAMVEDPNPPAYEPLNTEDTESGATLTGEGHSPEGVAPITSSIRATSKLLRSVGGWRSNFRGIYCAFCLVLLKGIAEGFFGAFTFSWIGSLLASLLMVQWSTAWVTIVISQPSPKSFWSRLPPLRKTFEATCFPVLVNWLFQSLGVGLPLVLADAVGLATWDPKDPTKVPKYDNNAAWKGLVVLIVSLSMTVFLVIPSQVVLRRVQASLLPPEEDAIIPFDRSFEGTVEPAIVGGKGYVTMKNAFKTFSRASWIRLYKLYFKIFLIATAVNFVIFGIVFAEIIGIAASTPSKGGN